MGSTFGRGTLAVVKSGRDLTDVQRKLLWRNRAAQRKRASATIRAVSTNTAESLKPQWEVFLKVVPEFESPRACARNANRRTWREIVDQDGLD